MHNVPILSIICYLPLAGALLIAFGMKSSQGALIRKVATGFVFVDFLLSLPLWFLFDRHGELFQFRESVPWIDSIGVRYEFGIDGIALLLVLLTTLLGVLAFLSSWSAIHDREKEYYIFLLLLQTGMLGVFMALDFFLFYVFWEVMLVPMYFLIGIWGGARRLYAAIKFFLYTLVVSVLSLIGTISGALVAIAQKDMKKLVAYSSLSHLGFVMLAMFALHGPGLNGSVLQMINHGLSTGALFLLVGVIYERRHTRLIAEYGGLSQVMPGYAVVFLIITMSSIGLPTLNAVVGEFTILVGAFNRVWWWGLIAALGIVLGAAYMLWMYQRVFFGPLTNPDNRGLQDLNRREILYLAPLILLCFWIGLYPKPFLAVLEKPVNYVVAKVDPHYATASPVPVAAAAAGE